MLGRRAPLRAWELSTTPYRLMGGRSLLLRLAQYAHMFYLAAKHVEALVKGLQDPQTKQRLESVLHGVVIQMEALKNVLANTGELERLARSGADRDARVNLNMGPGEAAGWGPPWGPGPWS